MKHPSGQLSRVVIKGFKSIKSGDIPLGRINVLIGSNGAGKSNFISVFDFLQSITSGNLQLSASRAGVNTLFYNGRKVTDEIDMEFFFHDRSYGFELIPTDDNRLFFRRNILSIMGKKTESLTFPADTVSLTGKMPIIFWIPTSSVGMFTTSTIQAVQQRSSRHVTSQTIVRCFVMLQISRRFSTVYGSIMRKVIVRSLKRTA